MCSKNAKPAGRTAGAWITVRCDRSILHDKALSINRVKGFVMSENGNGKLPPYTPVFDMLVRCYDGETALVYGYVWRMNQLDLRVCCASQDTIGKAVGLSIATVKRRIKILVDDGWLIDSDKGMKGGIHHLYITQRLEIERQVRSH